MIAEQIKIIILSSLFEDYLKIIMPVTEYMNI